MSTPAVIKFENVRKTYQMGPVTVDALRGVSVAIEGGEYISIMGSSRCGKSTLLNIVGLLDDPDDGSFLFNGLAVADYNARKRADLRTRNIGFVFQRFNLIDSLTVFANAELSLLSPG